MDQISTTVKAFHFYCPYMSWCWSSWKNKGRVHMATHEFYIIMLNWKIICCFTIYASYF